MLELTKKKKSAPHPKTKKKPQWDGRRGCHHDESNPIPSRWVTYRLENSNTKEVLTPLWRFWTPHQASQSGDPTKGLEIPKESGFEDQRDLIIGFPEKETETPVLEGTYKILHTPRPRGGEQWPHRRLNQNYLLVEGLLWRHGLVGGREHWKVPLGVNPLEIHN